MLLDSMHCGYFLACAAGVDYLTREVAKELLFVQCMEDDNSLNKDVYGRHTWPESELWTKGGRVVQLRMEGPGIQRPCAMLAISVLPVVVRERWQFTTRAARCTGG